MHTICFKSLWGWVIFFTLFEKSLAHQGCIYNQKHGFKMEKKLSLLLEYIF